MKEKGFTLIEIVGIIVLLSLMILIIIPTVERSIKVGQQNADNQLKENIILAAKNWATDHKDNMPMETGIKVNIWLTDLQKEGYIERNIKLPSSGANVDQVCVEATNKSTTTSRKDIYDYRYNDNCTINLDLVIIGKIDGTTPIASGTWTNKDITLTAMISYIGTYQWYTGSTAISGATSKNYIATRAANTEGKVTYKVKVQAERSTPEASYVAAIDKKAPTITTTTKTATKNNLTITLTESSRGSGLKGYAITNSPATPTSWTTISGSSYVNTFSKDTGTYYIHAKDAVGNTTYKSVSILAMDPPSCSISTSGTIGNNGWYRSNVGVSLNTAGTVNAKGLSTSVNSTNGVTSTTHSTDTSGTTYYGYVSNIAGSSSCSKTLKRDTIAPAISVTSKVSQSSNLTISLQDGYSGLAGYNITTSPSTPGTWITLSGYSYSTTVTRTTGTYYIHAKDAAGNTTYKSVYVQSLVPPTCSISTSGTYGLNSWYKSNVTVSMTTSGTVTSKGLATTKNSTNGKTSVVHSSDGKSITYYGYVYNAAGSNSCSKTFKRDANGPNITTSNNSGGNWTNQNVIISANSTDSISGVSKTTYSYSSNGSSPLSDWLPGSTPTQVSGLWSGERNNTVYIVSTDYAGNTSIKNAGAVRIDKTPPYITFSFRQSDKLGTCTANDSASGVSSFNRSGTYYYHSVGAGCAYNGPHTIDVHAQGTWWFNFSFHCGGGSTITFTCNGACDYAGNCGGAATSPYYSW